MNGDRKKTDWSEYYRKPFFLAKFTRAILRKRLFKAISCHLPDRHAFDVAELGGGASCYMNMILHNFTVRKYHIFDNNAESLRVTSALAGADYESAVRVHEVDLLNHPLPELECNIVFSGGLIEHLTSRVLQRSSVNISMPLPGADWSFCSFPSPRFSTA